MKTLTYILLFALLNSCRPSAENDIRKMEALISRIEKMNQGATKPELEKISEEFKEIDKHFQANRSRYSEEETTRYNKTIGAFYAAVIKLGLEEFGNHIEDLTNQMKGAAEELIGSDAFDTAGP